MADINMIRFNINCPQGFPKITAAGKRMCRGQSSRCTSTTFSSHGIEYSRVCGRINGSTTDAFNSGESIDTAFVDGIVLTHGSPRQHIWTFAAANTQYGTGESGCPCNGHTVSFSRPPYIDNDYCTFVGDDYFCDHYNTRPPLTYLTNDPLWDGAGCIRGSCCTFNSPPRFCKTLPHHMTDDIELHLCVNKGLNNEDLAFTSGTLHAVSPQNS